MAPPAPPAPRTDAANMVRLAAIVLVTRWCDQGGGRRERTSRWGSPDRDRGRADRRVGLGVRVARVTAHVARNAGYCAESSSNARAASRSWGPHEDLARSRSHHSPPTANRLPACRDTRKRSPTSAAARRRPRPRLPRTPPSTRRSRSTPCSKATPPARYETTTARASRSLTTAYRYVLERIRQAVSDRGRGVRSSGEGPPTRGAENERR